MENIDRLLGKKVLVHYIEPSQYTKGLMYRHVYHEVNVHKIKGIFDNYSEPMFYIDGGDEYGFTIIPRHCVVYLKELVNTK